MEERMKRNLLFAACFLSAALAAADTSKLHLKVYTASAEGFMVTSTLVYGEKDAVLIDAQFTQSDAHRLAATLLESHKNLGTVYVTHFHPDHYFGLNVLKQTFPNLKIVALPTTIEEIKASREGKVKQWGPMYGNNLTSDPIVPEPLDGTSINLEGETLQVVGNVQGDAKHNSYVWIPTLGALIAGDIVYNGIYPWTLEVSRADRKAWIKALEKIIALKPAVVVAGHKKPDLPDDLSAVEFTKSYLTSYDTLLASSKTPDEFVGKVKARFPGLSLDIILKLAADAALLKKP
jgi:glyoxylase-like metal-dependent hydrolase (beta-lactamase superfamily II)